MATNWKKRYSFRLTDKDVAIHEFLEGLPDNKRSEAIRFLLRTAVKYLHVEQNQQGDFQQVMQELRKIQEQMDSDREIIRQLTVGSTQMPEAATDREEEDMSNRAITDTANAFLSSFGMNGNG
ncbi:hypothetical protein ACFOGI_15335 [Virgibacillus xinjiangensis]|uniref:Plasmid segregation centromere-binding protein ParR n=1 Tax=Virgibacillus xinjiangensis TaxID=393090 RepID=A0ABV7CYZ7_9BACI